MTRFLKTIGSEMALIFQFSRLNRIRFFSYIGFAFFVGLSFAAGIVILNPPKYFFINLIGIYICLFAGLCIWWTIRRLNDANYSGFFALPFFGSDILEIALKNFFKVSLLLDFLISIISLISFLVLFLMSALLPGTRSENRFGHPPQGNNFFNYFFACLYLLVIIFGSLDVFVKS